MPFSSVTVAAWVPVGAGVVAGLAAPFLLIVSE
jgi:hypothetical protein